jgi:SAM-dependent methyltransferase
VHDTAYEHGRLFFELYGSETCRTIVELGSQDVNGSLRDHCPPGVHYIGLDMVPGKGVDLVVDPGEPLPLRSETADAVVTSSAFEHDVCFWDTFLNLIRILRPGGLLYVNVPSNGGFHRHPLDCWRFYPDAGAALVQWAARRGFQMDLVESFIGRPKTERWADFVAVFRRAGGPPLVRKGRIADHVPCINIHDLGMTADAPLQAESADMPDMRLQTDLGRELAEFRVTTGEDLAAAAQREAMLSEEFAASRRMLSDELAASRSESDRLRQKLGEMQTHMGELEAKFADAREELSAMQNSASWRVTAGPRRLMLALRGR